MPATGTNKGGRLFKLPWILSLISAKPRTSFSSSGTVSLRKELSHSLSSFYVLRSICSFEKEKCEFHDHCGLVHQEKERERQYDANQMRYVTPGKYGFMGRRRLMLTYNHQQLLKPNKMKAKTTVYTACVDISSCVPKWSEHQKR